MNEDDHDDQPDPAWLRGQVERDLDDRLLGLIFGKRTQRPQVEDEQ